MDKAETERLMQTFDLLSLVGGLVNLRHAGGWYTGPCPLCGGKDRFNMRQTPTGWRWLCRKCAGDRYYNSIHLCERLWGLDFKATVERMAGQQNVMSEEERLAIAVERARLAQEELAVAIATAEQKLEQLRQTKPWRAYHDNLNQHTRQLWQYRGVPDFWQDWWELGYDPGRKSLAIPIFAPDWQIRQVKHRLLTAGPGADRYAIEMPGLPSQAWLSNPDAQAIAGPTFVAEGEIKAMVVAATYDDERLQTVGLPSKNPGPVVLSSFAKMSDPIYLCPDPDLTEEEILGLARAMGIGQVRVIRLPVKIDDAINRYSLDKTWLQKLMNDARKVG